MKTIIFDIETGPLPLEKLEVPPFEPPANIKDPEKLKERELKYVREFVDKAALDALTGRVLAIGLKPVGGEASIILEDDERELLASFWAWLVRQAESNSSYPILVGFNSNSFDWPFLFRRSWVHGITPDPGGVYRAGRYWSDRQTIDLRDVWQLGDRMAKGSLDAVSRALGLPGKTGSGADFAGLLETDRAKAIEYLVHDLELTEQVYERMMGRY